MPHVKITYPDRAVFYLAAWIVVLVLCVGSYARNRIYRDSSSLWQDVISKSPDKQRSRHNYACSLSAAKRYQEAISEFYKVLAQKPDGTVKMTYLFAEMGLAYYHQEQYGEALSVWRRGLALAPGNAELMNDIAMALLMLRDLSEALVYAEMAVKADASMVEARDTLGEVHMAREEYDQALASFLRVAEREPGVDAREWNMARAYAKLGSYDNAYYYAKRVAGREQNEKLRKEATALMERLRSNKKH